MSLSLPNVGHSRRSKTILSPEGTTAKFLYYIIKQLDLKTIDWNEVASHLDITNGHAARMRYSRFKTQIEALLKEGRVRPRIEGNEGKVKSKDKSKRHRDDKKPDVLRVDSQLNEYDDDMRKRIKYDGSSYDYRHYTDGAVKVESGHCVPSSTALNVKTESEMQQARVQPHTATDFAIAAPLGTLHPTMLNQSSIAGFVSAPSAMQPSLKVVSKADSQRPSTDNGNSQVYSAAQAMIPNQLQYQYPYTYSRNPINGCYQYPTYAQTQAPHNHLYAYTDPRFQQHYQHNYPQSGHQASTYELAAQASYPWPYSESSIPRSVKNANQPDTTMPTTTATATKPDPGIDGDIDFAQFANDFGDEWNGPELLGKPNTANKASETVSPAAQQNASTGQTISKNTKTDATLTTAINSREKSPTSECATADVTAPFAAQHESRNPAVKTECTSPRPTATSIRIDQRKLSLPQISGSAASVSDTHPGGARVGTTSQVTTARRSVPQISHEPPRISLLEAGRSDKKATVKIEPEIEVL